MTYVLLIHSLLLVPTPNFLSKSCATMFWYFLNSFTSVFGYLRIFSRSGFQLLCQVSLPMLVYMVALFYVLPTHLPRHLLFSIFILLSPHIPLGCPQSISLSFCLIIHDHFITSMLFRINFSPNINSAFFQLLGCLYTVIFVILNNGILELERTLKAC